MMLFNYTVSLMAKTKIYIYIHTQTHTQGDSIGHANFSGGFYHVVKANTQNVYL